MTLSLKLHVRRCGWLVGAWAAAVFGPALEAQIVVLSNTATTLPAVATARYRLSTSEWDLGIYNGRPAPTGADFVTVNLGNESQLSGDTFRFSLEHRAGQGLIWKFFDNSDPLGPAGGTAAWGTFTPVIPTGSSTQVRADLNGELPAQFFNVLSLETRAFAAGSEMHLSNVAFSGATTVGTINNVSAFFNNTGASYVATLESDTDLSTFNWTLAGQIRGVKSGGGAETVTFNVHLVAIPEPGTSALLLLGLMALLGASMRHRASGRGPDRLAG
jgi:hypothetical protein